MLDPTCEDIQHAAAAERDGEPATLDQAVVRGHLSTCDACRLAVAAEVGLSAALSGVRLAKPSPPSVWPTVERAIAPPPWATGGWLAAVGAGAVAVTEALVLGPGAALGWPGRLAPLAVAVGLFVALGTNPFRVEPGLGRSPVSP